MADLSVFTYTPGESGLHEGDARFKLLTLLLLTVTISTGRLWSLFAVNALLVTGLFLIRVPLPTLLKEMRYFGAFLLVVWLVRALGTPGRIVVSFGPLALTLEGAGQGGLICWQMVTVLMAGLLFTRTTRMVEVRAATAWLLKPIPFLNTHQAALMLGLLVRFIPLILTQAKEIRQAQQARGLENRRSPFLRLTAIAFPLLRATLIKSDRIATAMAARGYTGRSTPFNFVAQTRDWMLLGLATLLASSHLWG